MTNSTHTWWRNLVPWANTPKKIISLFFTAQCWQVWEGHHFPQPSSSLHSVFWLTTVLLSVCVEYVKDMKRIHTTGEGALSLLCTLFPSLSMDVFEGLPPNTGQTTRFTALDGRLVPLSLKENKACSVEQTPDQCQDSGIMLRLWCTISWMFIGRDHIIISYLEVLFWVVLTLCWCSLANK